METRPITLYGHTHGPNPWKVAMILEELNVPYETTYVPTAEVKKEPFVSVNPNGRLPAIEDPNTGITLWESGAIIEYLVETYDKDKKISFPAGTPEYFHAKQWIHFQVSGQGPYFGQAVWFRSYHPEKVPSAQERYKNEVLRVSGVLDKVLQDREYLVGGRFSYADVSFLPWYDVFGYATDNDVDMEKEFPNLNSWLKRMRERPAMTKVSKDKADVVANQPR
ncbi:glutathione S-transferase [Aspergillus sclerotiicarbonarius CBS 121057]|uniref:glutathione transferase n=1 Tax=Aspergillus sclerotiicarbonarius (strain CBS 121057 / IBT 28362) TaxID=1448318 RepID=A0A319DUG9_ASPSB|nr:glutathione S-transferase [Aspergillus sclerotiicarbonarius CBS 121057]